MIAKFNNRPDDRPLLGEIGIPSTSGVAVALDRISHEVDSIFIEGDNVMATINVLDTPMGDVLKTLLTLEPRSVGLAPRGLGTVDEDGNIDDYKLITVDIARSPGAE